ncbi:MAG: DUF3240 family protein [Methylotetracoccus sp.]
MAESLYLLSLMAPPELEESLIDWLLGVEGCQGFSSYPANGHSNRPQTLSLAEQVSGRRRQVRFEICLDRTLIERMVGELRDTFAGAGIRYWVVPVDASGDV